jgi:hypothetical protein
MAEYPRYLISTSVFAGTPEHPKVHLVKASIYAKRAINWHPDRAPSRKFEPLNQAAVDQLEALYQEDLESRGEENVAWKPLPIPRDEGEVQNELALDVMKDQIALLTKRLEDGEKARAEAHEVEKKNEGTADMPPLEVPPPKKPAKGKNPSDASPV